MFCWWLKDRWLNVSDAHNQQSEESRKLTYLKLPHLWIIKAFLSTTSMSKTTSSAKGETKKKRSHSFQYQWSRSSYLIQFKQQQILWTWINQAQKTSSDEESKRATVPTDVYYSKLWRDQVIEDLPTDRIILNDVTQVIHWRPHLGGDC